jgi:hypothetical protein
MISRAVLAAAGVLLLVSLFLPWFSGVSGWEQWAWADLPLAALAAGFVAAAVLPPLPAFRIAVAVLGGLGVAVVLGHGLEPRVEVGDYEHIAAGAHLALVALACGAIAAVTPWPRRAAPVLLVAAAAGLVAALLSGWGYEAIDISPDLSPDGERVYSYSYELVDPNGFERWHVLDIGLLLLAAGLLVAASGRLRGALRILLAVAGLAAAACVAVSGRSVLRLGDGGLAEGVPMGQLAALLSLAAALAGLALVRPRERAARAG